jgi:hypothetical protein
MIGFLSAAPEVAKLIGAVVQALIDALASGNLAVLEALERDLPSPAVIEALAEARIALKRRLGAAEFPPAP